MRIKDKYLSVFSLKRLRVFIIVSIVLLAVYFVQLFRIMIIGADYYGDRALAVQERERSIKAKRGIIYDRNGVILAGNIPVCSVSVINAQITDAEQVISSLSSVLELDESEVREKVNKVSSREIIKANVSEEKADQLRELNLDGVMIDEDYKRYYPYDSLASKVIGFTGADNQGIVGLETIYDDVLMGTPGSINTLVDAGGIEIPNAAETRVEPVDGNNLVTTIDVNIQQYVEQLAYRTMTLRSANRVCIIVINPQNGEIYAMCDVPEYNLNEPFELNYEVPEGTEITLDMLNRMWRNFCINDTYEPGSIFKIITATSAFEDGVVEVEDTFNCPGFRVVEDRRIKCHKVIGHGTQTFKEGIMNSCNPVFMDIGARVGVSSFYGHMEDLGLFEKTGVDLPGEGTSIFHKQENVGPVELATMSFGQSFQITPLQLVRAVSAVVNGGNLVTPHFGLYVTNYNNNIIEKLDYSTKTDIISEDTSLIMRELLLAVVSEGTGKNAYIEGYTIGGKTATSEKLPRSANKYISSFLGFAPADNPQVLTLILIDEPVGTYYGGTIAAPVVRELYENILPYLGIDKVINSNAEEEVFYYEDTVF